MRPAALSVQRKPRVATYGAPTPERGLTRMSGVSYGLGMRTAASLYRHDHDPQSGKGARRLAARADVALAGQVYFVTFTTHGRPRVFAEPECAMATARTITDRRLWQHSQLPAWVSMPDHWHGLVRLGDAQDLSRLVRKLKANSARCLPGHTAPVWATAFHDHALRTEEDLVAHVRYLVVNPVSAGLAARAGNYPSWDAGWS